MLLRTIVWSSIMLIFLCKISASFAKTSIEQQSIVFAVESFCSVNFDINAACYDLNESQCRSAFSEFYTACSQNFNGLLFNPSSSSSIDIFQNCLIDKFEEFLVAEGVDLDKSCN